MQHRIILFQLCVFACLSVFFCFVCLFVLFFYSPPLSSSAEQRVREYIILFHCFYFRSFDTSRTNGARYHITAFFRLFVYFPCLFVFFTPAEPRVQQIILLLAFFPHLPSFVIYKTKACNNLLYFCWQFSSISCLLSSAEGRVQKLITIIVAGISFSSIFPLSTAVERKVQIRIILSLTFFLLFSLSFVTNGKKGETTDLK